MKKLIFSRKGADSRGEKTPSPIFSNGEILSIPIRSDPVDRVKYSELQSSSSLLLSDIMQKLGINYYNDYCHFDPDLRSNQKITRSNCWRPAFGQAGRAQGHLRNQGVSIHDLFLFFGWFREVISDTSGSFCWKNDNFSDWHVIFGYLQIGKIHNANSLANLPPYLIDHPHSFSHNLCKTNNVIYEATEKLTINNNYSGAGVFSYRPSLKLTKDGCSRSKWNLNNNAFFNKKITHHGNYSWKNTNNTDEYFQSYRQGQEFVVDIDDDIMSWLVKSIFV